MAKVLIEEGRAMLCITDGDSKGTEILDGVEKIRKNELEKKEARLKTNPEEASIPFPIVEKLQLDKGASIEDIFADKQLLLKAVKNVANNLVSLKLRTFVEGFKIEDGIKSIDSASGKTLGAIINDETEKWFTKKERISKLSIALEYDRLAHEEEYSVSKKARAYVIKIKHVLNLKGEKSAESGVLGEVQ